jgi:geranylgeranyl pyrophosphate synthase
VLLSAQSGPSGPAGAALAMPLAVACEILHTATLVHDDLVDQAALRRGLPTVAARWGTRVAVLSGDYLFARALTLVALLGRPEISVRLGEVVQGMCEAELEQVERAYDISYTETEYLGLVRRKSATLIAECCRSGADIAGAPEDVSARLHRYGEGLGIAFQIADDILDVVAAAADVGKPTGGDLGLGLLTLPVIYAAGSSPELRELLRRQLSGVGDRQRAMEIIRAGDAVSYARAMAQRHVDAAIAQLDFLPPGEPRDSLAFAAAFAVHRSR